MRRPVFTHFWIVLTCFCGISQGQEPATNSSPTARQVEEIQSQIERLVDGSSEAQAAAELQLVEIGPLVLDHLPAITDATPESVRARMMRIRIQLEKKLAARLMEPTRVTLRGTMRLSEALAEIAEQTGNRVIDNRESYGQESSDPEVKTDLDDVSFWEAVETLLERTGMVVDPNVLEPQSLGFVGADNDGYSAIRHARSFGRFRFEPLRTEAFRNLRNDNDRILRLGLEVSWEPVSTPVALVYRPDTIVAVDENGDALDLVGPDQPTEIPVQETGAAVEIDIPFDLPEANSRRIEKLTGTFDAMIPGQYAEFEFSDLTAKRVQTKSQGGVTLKLQRVREAQNLVDVWILVQIQAADELLQSHRGWIYNNPAQLLAPDGTRHEYVGMDTFRQTETEFGISYKYDVVGDLNGFKFTYRTPAAILTVPVDFELTDIRLPLRIELQLTAKNTVVGLAAIIHSALTFGVLAAQPLGQATEVVVAACVNGANIHVAEVHRHLNRLPFINDENRDNYAPWALQALIDRQLVLEYLQQRTRFLAPGEVEDALERRRQALGRRGQLLETVLSDAGIDQAAMTRSITWSLIWPRYLAKHLSLERQRKYFQQHAAHFDGRALEVAHILWQLDDPADPQLRQQAIQEARQVLTKIREGSLSIAEAAKAYSDGPSAAKGGELGVIHRDGPMTERFSKAAFDLKPGETSEPISDQFGFHLIHCISTTPGKRKFAEVQFEVERAARKELFQALVQRVRNKGKVEYTGVIAPFPLDGEAGSTVEQPMVDDPLADDSSGDEEFIDQNHG